MILSKLFVGISTYLLFVVEVVYCDVDSEYHWQLVEAVLKSNAVRNSGRT
jgi:hypothetical protein